MAQQVALGNELANIWRGARVATAVLGLWGLALAGRAAAQVETPGPIAVHGNITTFEIAPVLLAAERYYPGPATVRMGGIPNLVGAPAIAGFGAAGVADVATHAETQALRYSVDHPDLRILMTVSEGLYRIVAKRSAGIASVADLKGRKIATIPPTSSGFFLEKMLKTAGLSFSDIQVGTVTPLTDFAKGLADGRVDAIAIWEPYSENAVRLLGDDAIEFSGKGVYTERFNLNTTAQNLADPVKRRKIVVFLRAIMDAAEAMRLDPAVASAAKALVVENGKFTPAEVDHAWPHQAFVAASPTGDLLDVLVEEEVWLAAQGKRPARDRATLATLIDASAYQEARALKANK